MRCSPASNEYRGFQPVSPQKRAEEILTRSTSIRRRSSGQGMCVTVPRRNVRTIAAAINSAATMWISEHAGECPTVANLLEDGQLDHSKNSKDPWENDFVIECDGDSVSTKSGGPDKQMGTEDDISI